MEERVNYALIGLFVVVLSTVFVGVVTWLAAAGDEKTYDTYVAYTAESVSGLSPKAAVKYRGVDGLSHAEYPLRSVRHPAGNHQSHNQWPDHVILQN